MLKQVQHDISKAGFPPLARNDTESVFNHPCNNTGLTTASSQAF
ncbi:MULTISPECIES: hypothetical protein [unclassified Rickettsia]